MHFTKPWLAVVLFGFLTFAHTATAQITHTITFDGRKNHYFEVESSFSVPEGEREMELVMAGWTPGSYLIRDYARHVENLTVDGAVIQKIAKNRWLFSNISSQALVLRYNVYGREMTVRTNWVDSSFAFINGASTFLRPEGREAEPHRIEIKLPEDWSASAASITKAKFRKNIYIAENWDEVVDSPIVAGNIEVVPVPTTNTKHPHYLVQVGDTSAWDDEKAAKAVGKIVDSHQAFWGTDPFEKPYYFLNIIADARGGLEHKHNTALMHKRFAMKNRDDWVNWMGLVAHEYFHSWNVKRLRPKALGPFDYESENYASELWFSEGLTSYYANLLNFRAGLIEQDEFLDDIANDAQYLDQTAGQTVRSVAEASFDAWIRGYRPDENTTNAHVSYYAKGAMIGLGLDTKIRAATNNEKSLDDLMRDASAQFSGETGFVNADVYALTGTLASADVGNWLKARVETAEYLSSDLVYEFLGLDMTSAKEPDADYPAAYLGFRFDKTKTDLIVSRVAKGTPAFDAGVNAEDELIAIDGNRVTTSSFSRNMEALDPDQEVDLLMARRGRIITLAARTKNPPLDDWSLNVAENRTEAQKENFKAWISAN